MNSYEKRMNEAITAAIEVIVDHIERNDCFETDCDCASAILKLSKAYCHINGKVVDNEI